MRFILSINILGFPCGSAGKEPACNVGDLGLIRGLGRSPKEGNGNPLQDSRLENPYSDLSLMREETALIRLLYNNGTEF